MHKVQLQRSLISSSVRRWKRVCGELFHMVSTVKLPNQWTWGATEVAQRSSSKLGAQRRLCERRINEHWYTLALSVSRPASNAPWQTTQGNKWRPGQPKVAELHLLGPLCVALLSNILDQERMSVLLYVYYRLVHRLLLFQRLQNSCPTSWG